MKITSIELYELRVPLNKPFTRSVRIGTLVDCTPVVCRIVTDDGLEGIGETNPVMPLTSEDAAVVVHVIREHLAPAVLGADPRNLHDIHRRREAVGPDYPLIADANQGWDVLRAVRFAKLVEDCGLALLEQPVPPEDIDGLAEVRRRTGLLISADESVHTLAQARRLIEKKAADVFSIKVIKHGGIRKAHAIMRYAEAHGILCLMNSNAEEGVTQAASLQLGAAASNLWPFGHAYRSPLRLAGDISTFSEHIRDGWVSLPTEPGLGVALKPDMLDRFLIRRHVITRQGTGVPRP